MDLGNGSTTQTDKGNGIKGGDSIIQAKKKVNSITTTDIKLLEAKGGNGGGMRKENIAFNCHGGSGGAQGAVSGASGFVSYNNLSGKGQDHDKQARDGKVYAGGCVTFSTAKKLNNMFRKKPFKTNGASSTSRCSKDQIGRGGDDSRTDSQYGIEGNNGYVLAETQIFHTGKGGEASEPEERFVPTFKERKLLVVVGKGGKGGTKGGIGTNGTDTTVKGATTGTIYAKSIGGLGGKSTYEIKAGINTPGGDGEKSLMYYKVAPTIGYGGMSGSNSSVDGMTGSGGGAGGGGGGANEDGDVGDGADGAPGYVIIEW